MLEQAKAPGVIFSDSILPDGTWAGVMRMAVSIEVPVIVISRVRDYQTFLDAMEAGAADCIAPPFFAADVQWVVRNALDGAATLRKRVA